MSFVITQPCCNDAACVSACPVNCIHPRPDEPEFATTEMLYIDPDGCIECGACVDPCPVDAIVLDSDLTDDTRRYADLNAQYYDDPARQDYPDAPYEPPPCRPEVRDRDRLRVAVIGSGPAGLYAVENLLAMPGLDVEVDLYERLLTPWGLVRHGVAPDHQGTKSVAERFMRAASRDRLDVHLNVEIGRHVSHEELLAHHHAVVYAVGTPAERRLGIPGEDLLGCHPATDLVAWYNGHPDFSGRDFDLSGRRAVVVGNGNVALDVARILTAGVNRLQRTDIADHALEAVSRSALSEVVVIGRRGPAQAAFTVSELLGLTTTTDVVVPPEEVQLDDASSRSLARPEQAIARMKVEVLTELSSCGAGDRERRIELRFLRAPLEILGDDRVRGLRLARTELVTASDGRLVARATEETEDIAADLVLTSVGHRATAIPALPFDDARGVLPHDDGRVVDPRTGAVVPGVYATGWIKRGPSGSVGTNKWCAEETVQALLEDFASGRLCDPSGGRDELRELIAGRQPQVVDLSGWAAIDRYERTAAGGRRPRIKLTDTAAMLAVIGAAQTGREQV